MPVQIDRPIAAFSPAMELLTRRRVAGISQRDAAKLLGLSYQLLCQYERGALPVSERVLAEARRLMPL